MIVVVSLVNGTPFIRALTCVSNIVFISHVPAMLAFFSVKKECIQQHQEFPGSSFKEVRDTSIDHFGNHHE